MVNRKIDSSNDGTDTDGHAVKPRVIDDAETEGHAAKPGRPFRKNVTPADVDGEAEVEGHGSKPVRRIKRG
jgi:hypothetical protein